MYVKVAILSIIAFMLTGCYESPGVTVHKPGDYKGETDPLLEKQRDAAHQEALRQRFNLVQTDR